MEAKQTRDDATTIMNKENINNTVAKTLSKKYTIFFLIQTIVWFALQINGLHGRDLRHERVKSKKCKFIAYHLGK